MSAQPQPRLINARDCLARFARGRKFALNYKINQQQCDFLMLYCCLPTHTYTRTHTHTNKQTSQHTNTYANGKREKQFIGVWGRESWRCLFFEQIDVVFDS